MKKPKYQKGIIKNLNGFQMDILKLEFACNRLRKSIIKADYFKPFRMVSFFNNHFRLYQILNRLEVSFCIDSDRSIRLNSSKHYDFLISIYILFWSIEFSFNLRKNEKTRKT